MWSQKVVKTRKQHKCAMCGSLIPKGHNAEHNAGLWDNEFQNFYLCTICCLAIKKYNPDLSDGFNTDELSNILNYNMSIWLQEINYEKDYIKFEDYSENEYKYSIGEFIKIFIHEAKED